MHCVGSRTVTSRASEGVKEGRASKIGVVSGEVIGSKLAASNLLETDLIDRGSDSRWSNG